MVEQAHYRPEQKTPANRAERIDALNDQIEELKEKITKLNAENKESGTHSEQIRKLEETLRATTQEFDSLYAAEEEEFDAQAPAPALVRANIQTKLQTEPSTDPTQVSENVKKSPHFTVEDMRKKDGKGRTFASGEDYKDEEAQPK